MYVVTINLYVIQPVYQLLLVYGIALVLLHLHSQMENMKLPIKAQMFQHTSEIAKGSEYLLSYAIVIHLNVSNL